MDYKSAVGRAVLCAPWPRVSIAVCGAQRTARQQIVVYPKLASVRHQRREIGSGIAAPSLRGSEAP